MDNRIISRLFLPLLLAGILCHASPLAAQIELRTVTVLLDEEAQGIFGVPGPVVMLTWEVEGSPPPGAQVRFLRASGDQIILEPIEMTSLDDFNANYIWGDIEAVPMLWSERYAMALVLVDEDGSVIQEFPISDIHGTIFLRELDAAADFDPCSRTITCRWDDYVYNDSGGQEPPLPPFFNHIQLMVLPPDGIVEVPDLTYNFDESLEGREATYVLEHGPGTYRFRVRALENLDESGRISYSNPQYIEFDSPVIDDPEIVTVDVVNNQYIELGIILQGSVDEFTYEVLRSNQADQGFEVVGTLDAAVPGLNVFPDMGVPDLQQGMWHYRVEARIRDADCENPSYASQSVSSLYLRGEVITQTTDQLEVSLSWVQDPGWDDFTLQRKLPENNDWVNLDDGLSGLPGSFIDDLSPLLENLAGEVRYRVIGTKGGEVVHSNEYLVEIEPRIEIPNVFNPMAVKEENQVFKPGFVGLSPTSMRLRIYNRWGQEVYSVSDPAPGWAGWDGTLSDGSEAPAGMYAYTLEYQFPGSPDTEIRGTLLLLR